MAVRLQSLVEVVSSGVGPEKVAEAVHEMGFIAAGNDRKFQALEDAVPQLLALVQTGDTQCKEAAIRTLQVMAEKNADWHQLIVKGGALEIFIEVLGLHPLSSGPAISAAAKGLWKLGMNNKAMQEAAAAKGCMPLLVRLLKTVRTTQPSGREIHKWVVIALQGLTTLSPEARQAANDCEAMQAALEVAEFAQNPEFKTLVFDLGKTLKPLINKHDMTTNVLSKSRYQPLGANACVTNQRGERLYCR